MSRKRGDNVGYMRKILFIAKSVDAQRLIHHPDDEASDDDQQHPTTRFDVHQNFLLKSRSFPYPVQWTVTVCPFCGLVPFPSLMMVFSNPMVVVVRESEIVQ